MWKLPLLCLAVGLTGTVTALPEPVATSSLHHARPTLLPNDCFGIVCIAEKHPVWNATTGVCECVWIDGFGPVTSVAKRQDKACTKIFIECEEGFHAECDGTTHNWSCEKDPEVIERQELYPDHKTCPLIRCRQGYHQFYDTATKKCTCKEDAKACTKIFINCLTGYHAVCDGKTHNWSCEPDVDPKTCPLIRCMAGTHPFYNPVDETCYCNKDDAKDICIAATECAVGTSPFWNATTETCSCKPIPGEITKRQEWPDPSTCPTIKCTDKTTPVYHPETKKCSCEPIIPVCPNSIFCGAGSHKVLSPKTKKCDCEADAGTETCPLMKCKAGNHVVYHPDTGKCGCSPDCPDLFCISEQTPTYNSSDRTCSCQWIPGFGPGEPLEAAKRTPEPAADPACKDSGIFCISEMEPRFNATLGKCECEWIPGLEPLSPIDLCADIMCISEMWPVLSPTTGLCECQWIPGLEPTGLDTRAPTTTLQTSTTKRTLPTPLVPSCNVQGRYCIPEMHFVYNATSGKCECEWIPGLGPVTSDS